MKKQVGNDSRMTVPGLSNIPGIPPVHRMKARQPSPKEDLKAKTASGLLWGGISNGAQQVLSLLFGVFIARLLTPEDYGMVGMLTIFSVIATAIQESGFTAALTNLKEARHEDFNAVFWFSVFTSAAIYLVLFCAAPLIAQFYHTPQLTPLARYTFVSFFISSLGIAHNAYMFRNLRVKQRTLMSFVSLVAAGTAGVCMAYFGMAYWGIATQTVVFVSCNTIQLWLFAGWHPSWHISFRPLSGMFAFGSKLLLTNVFTHINNNILTVLLGRFYDERAVGNFTQGNKWTYMGCYSLQGMINSVAQPVLQQVAADKSRQLRVFRKMLRFTAFVSFPAMFGLSLVAPELITIAVTDKWEASASMMRILCAGAAFLPLATTSSSLIISHGRSDIHLRNTVAFGAAQIIAAICCSTFGVEVMICVYASINVFWTFVWYAFARQLIGLRLIEAFKDVAPYALVAGASMLAAGALAQCTQNIYLSLTLKVTAGASIYLSLMWLLGSVTMREAAGYIFKNRKH